MSAHDDILARLADYQVEHEKFEKGNNAAGTRARKALGELAKAVKHAVMKSLLLRTHVRKQRPKRCVLKRISS